MILKYFSRVSYWVGLFFLYNSFSFCISAYAYGLEVSELFLEDHIEERIESLLGKMTLAEKVGQMTQADKVSIDQNPSDIEKLGLGSILSGGGQTPQPNTPANWVDMVNSYQLRAMSSRLQIPLIYGVDAVHGHGNMVGATVFPHNVGLGATRDLELVRKIGQITGFEVLASGIHWNFAPAIPVSKDIRWGRAYEAFGEDTDLVTQMGQAFTQGHQAIHEYRGRVQALGTAKHFVGDGGTTWMTSPVDGFKLDRGDTRVDEQTLRAVHLKPYYSQLSEGIQTVMASYSSWNGVPMHEGGYLITDVLKGEMGFDGFVVSDWLAVSLLEKGTYDDKVVRSINSGIDMVMAVYEYRSFIQSLIRVVEQGRVSMERVNDAVRRILRVKLRFGLFSRPYATKAYLNEIRSEKSRQVAEEAVRKSAVLIKNENLALPIQGCENKLLVVGEAADDIGLQSGGWTVEWQGHRGNIIPGTTIVSGLEKTAPIGWNMDYVREIGKECTKIRALDGEQSCALPKSSEAKYSNAVVVIAEPTYAEGVGDSETLEFSFSSIQKVRFARQYADKITLVVYSGRPMIVNVLRKQVDAMIAAWLPGTEVQGLVDLILGKENFSGKLSFTWPKSIVDFSGAPVSEENTLFPFGYGLEYKESNLSGLTKNCNALTR